MRSDNFEAKIAPRRRVMTILWGALSMAILIYIGVAYMVAPEQTPAPDLDLMRIAMYAAAVTMAVLSFVLPSRLLSDERIRQVMDEDMGSEVENPHEMRLLKLSTLYMQPFIVRLALNESVAIFGLVLCFMSANPADILPFAGLAVALNLFAMPNLEKLFERAG